MDCARDGWWAVSAVPVTRFALSTRSHIKRWRCAADDRSVTGDSSLVCCCMKTQLACQEYRPRRDANSPFFILTGVMSLRFFSLLGKTCWRWLDMCGLCLSEVCLFLLLLFLCSLFRKDRDLHEVEGNCKNGWTCFLWKLLPLWYHWRICPWREVLQPEMCPASKKQVGAILKHRNKEFGVNAAAWDKWWDKTLMVGQREVLSSRVLVSLRQFVVWFRCFSCDCVTSVGFCLMLMLKAVCFAQRVLRSAVRCKR